MKVLCCWRDLVPFSAALMRTGGVGGEWLASQKVQDMLVARTIIKVMEIHTPIAQFSWRTDDLQSLGLGLVDRCQFSIPTNYAGLC